MLVGSLYKKQTRLVSEHIASAEKDLEAGNEFEAGEKLLAAKRGGPRNKRLLKLFADDFGSLAATKHSSSGTAAFGCKADIQNGCNPCLGSVTSRQEGSVFSLPAKIRQRSDHWARSPVYA